MKANPLSQVDQEAEGATGIALNGFTAQQISLIFAEIATQANALSKLAMAAPCEGGEAAGTPYCFILGRGLHQIGVLADYAIGGDCIGGIPEWLLGKNFVDQGVSA